MSRDEALAAVSKIVVPSYGSKRYVDKVLVKAISGSGGSGCTTFLRGKYQPVGPPAGGNGGKGGNVWFEATDKFANLHHVRHQYKAPSGEPGQGKNRHGKSAEDLTLTLPAGTVIRKWDALAKTAGDVLIDLAKPGMKFLAATGGRGGRGNATFASSTNRSPQEKEPGGPAETYWYQLELRLIADVGLVGYPNAGKSTLLSVLSNAAPKIASYAFTTLRPQIGTLEFRDDRISVADLPGLIEGAHRNVGLGHEFLRHIERTKVICYVIDMSGTVKGQNPVKDYIILRKELELYNPDLLQRPFIIVANKMDLKRSTAQLVKFRAFLSEQQQGADVPVIPISAMNNDGIDAVKTEIRRLTEQGRAKEAQREAAAAQKAQDDAQRE